MIQDLPEGLGFPGAQLIGKHEPGSPEWHELRAGAIGGSQVGAILGLNPWESAVTAFYKATGQIDSSITPSISMRLGTKLEEPILEIFAEDHPELEVFRVGTYAATNTPWAHANPDALYRRKDGTWGVIEVKFSRDFWTEVPPHYRAQVAWYQRILGIKEGVLVALAGSTYKEYELPYQEFEADAIWQEVSKFRTYCDQGTQPDWDGSESTYETIRQLNPEIEDATVELGDLGMHLVLAQAELKEAQAKFTELQSRTLDAMGAAKYGVVEAEGIETLVCQRQQRAGGLPYLVMKGKK